MSETARNGGGRVSGFQEPRTLVDDRGRVEQLRIEHVPAASDGRGAGALAGAASSERSYYGRAILKQPVWTWEIPLYFITGGIAGASSGLAFAAQLAGNRRLARRAQLAAFAGVSVSPALLISDLGRPARFLNMLRMFKPTSPMSMGSWLLAANGGAITLATAGSLSSRTPRLTRTAQAGAAVLGMPLTTYTAVLIADTAVPIWHEGRRELPFIFGGSSTAGAGALATLLTPAADAGPARRMAVLGTAIEAIGSQLMERRLGRLAEPLKQGHAGRLALAAKSIATAGAVSLALAGRRRTRLAKAGAAMVLAGEVLERWAIFRAGFQSAADPSYTVGPQRKRIETGASAGAAHG